MEADGAIRAGNNVCLVTSIGKDLHILEQMLLDANPLRQKVACQLVILLGTKHPSAFMLISSYLARKSKTDTQLELLVKILSDNLNR